MKRYDVVINGCKTTLLLSDADAKAAGLTSAAPEVPETAAETVVTTKAKTPVNKSRKPANKSVADDE